MWIVNAVLQLSLLMYAALSLYVGQIGFAIYFMTILSLVNAVVLIDKKLLK